MNQILAVIGMCGAGKSEVVNHLMTKGYQRVYFGQPTFDELKRLNQPITEANERAARENLRKKHGMACMAILSVDKVRELLRTGNVVIESMYSWEEYKIIKEEFKDQFSALAVYTTKKLRYERLAKRPHRPLTSAECQSRDLSELENLNKGNPIAYADYLIVNDGTISELTKKAEEIIKKLN